MYAANWNVKYCVPLIAMLLFSSGCGVVWQSLTTSVNNAQTPKITNEFLYSCLQGGAVIGYQVNTITGALTPVPGPMPSSLYCVEAKIISISNTVQLFVETDGNGTEVYRVDPNTGALSPTFGSPLSPGTSFFTVSPNNKYIFGLNGATATSLFSFNLGADGNVGSEVGSYAFAAGGNQYYFNNSFFATPDGKYIYALEQGDQVFSVFNIQPNGSLTGTALTYPAACTYASGWLMTDPLSKYLFASCYKGSSTHIQPYTINAGGTLTPGTLTTAGNVSINASFDIDKTGTYFYIQSTSGGIIGFSIGAGGNLTPLSGGADLGTAGSLPIVDRTNTYVAAYNTGLSLYKIKPDGTLITGANSPATMSVFTSYSPGFDLTGQFVYASSNYNIYGFKIDPATATLTPVPGSPFPGSQYGGNVVFSQTTP